MQAIIGLVCGCAAPIADQPQKKKKNHCLAPPGHYSDLLHRNTGAESREKSVQR